MAGAVLLFVSPTTIVCSLPDPIVVCTTGVTSAAGPGVGAASAGASSLPESTETLPLSAGIEIISADSINTIAAPIVNLDSTEADPRRAKAVLETLLVNKAPASGLPKGIVVGDSVSFDFSQTADGQFTLTRITPLRPGSDEAKRDAKRGK